MNAKHVKGTDRRIIVALPLAALLMGNALPVRQPANNPVLDVGCSQGALDARDDFSSASRPTRLEFVGKSGERLGGTIVTLSHADGRDPTTISCGTPRLLMRLEPGRYMAVVDMSGGPTRTFAFNMPAGQHPRRLVFRFPSMAEWLD